MKEKLKHLFSRNFALPKAARVEEAIGNFSLTEKAIFYTLAAILVVSSIKALYDMNMAVSVDVPNRGGNLTEGVIGLPRFINPVLALSDADRDLNSITYSGLLKATPQGNLVPDLAQSYSISSDGLTYTFTLKPKLKFHDGTALTADDVVFTIERAEDPTIKSPKRPNWEGVLAQKVDDLTVKLTLKQPYSPFLENTTLGILPKHIWNNVTSDEFPFSQFNIEPVGSGPYKLKSVERNSSGIPISYRLEAFDGYAFGAPLISNVIIRFFQSNGDLMAAYKNGVIESMAGISPGQAADIKANGGRVEETPLPRIFAVFFNQNQAPVLANKEVRQALELATDKEQIVETVLGGAGIAIDGPVPPGLLPTLSGTSGNSAKQNITDRIAAAKKLLENANWKLNSVSGVYEKKVKKAVVPLSFSISTSNAPELKAAAMMLVVMRQKIGVKVDVKISDIGELNQNVIRSRKYDALLFGEIIGRDLDMFAFWHSSQRNDPGLNIALYTNAKVDKLLENARTISDQKSRLDKYLAIEQEIQNDIPAIFIYSPNFLYVVPKNLKGFSLGHITVPAERFLGIEKWYVETERVLQIFAPKQ